MSIEPKKASEIDSTTKDALLSPIKVEGLGVKLTGSQDQYAPLIHLETNVDCDGAIQINNIGGEPGSLTIKTTGLTSDTNSGQVFALYVRDTANALFIETDNGTLLTFNKETNAITINGVMAIGDANNFIDLNEYGDDHITIHSTKGINVMSDYLKVGTLKIGHYSSLPGTPVAETIIQYNNELYYTNTSGVRKKIALVDV